MLELMKADQVVLRGGADDLPGSAGFGDAAWRSHQEPVQV